MERQTKTSVRSAAVLTYLELIEQTGYSTRPWLDELGVNPSEGDAPLWVEWDPFARLLHSVFTTLGPDRARDMVIESVTQSFEARSRSGGETQRQCFADHVAARQAAWPPHRYSFEPHGDGFATFFVHVVPAPLFAPESLFEVESEVVARIPCAAGLPPATLLDTCIDPSGRRAEYFLELADEVERPSLGPLGDAIEGAAVVPTLDIAELAGVDPAPWLNRHELSRSALLEGRRVDWPTYRELITAIGTVGEERCRDAARELAALTHEIRPLVEGLPDLVAVYQALHGEGVFSFWGPLAPAVVRSIRPGVLAIRLGFRRDIAGCRAHYALHAGTLEGLTAHRDLPPAETRTMHVTGDESSATFVVDLPEERGPTTASSDDTSITKARIAGTMFRERQAARAAVVERPGRELAMLGEVHDIAEAVVETMAEALGTLGVEIELATGEGGALVPIRARGPREGAPLQRNLHYADGRIGRLRVWSAASASGETLAALDVVGPWIAVALGTALERAGRAAEIATARATREEAENTLNGVLRVHPRATFLLDATGQVEPMNVPARGLMQADASGTLARIAAAIGEPERSGFDILPVEIAGYTHRIVAIERPSTAPSYEETLERAAAEWRLTRRQREVVDRLARGMSNKEIASSLGCAEVTVENHLTSIYRKADVDGRNRLIAKLTDG